MTRPPRWLRVARLDLAIGLVGLVAVVVTAGLKRRKQSQVHKDDNDEVVDETAPDISGSEQQQLLDRLEHKSSGVDRHDDLKSLDHDTVEFELTFKENVGHSNSDNGSSSTIPPIEYTSTLQTVEHENESARTISDIADNALTSVMEEIISKDSSIESPEESIENDDDDGDDEDDDKGSTKVNQAPADKTVVVVDKTVYDDEINNHVKPKHVGVVGKSLATDVNDVSDDTNVTVIDEVRNDVPSFDVTSKQIDLVREDSPAGLTSTEKNDPLASIVEGSTALDTHLRPAKSKTMLETYEKRVHFDNSSTSKDATINSEVVPSATSIDERLVTSNSKDLKNDEPNRANFESASVAPSDNLADFMPLLVEETFTNFGTTEFLLNKANKIDNFEGSTKPPTQNKKSMHQPTSVIEPTSDNKLAAIDVVERDSSNFVNQFESGDTLRDDTASVALSEDDWQSTKTSHTADGGGGTGMQKSGSDSDDDWMSCDSGASPRNLTSV